MSTRKAGSYPGTMLLQHPILQPEAYMDGDKQFRDSCCDPLIGNTYCNEFFNRRPVSTVHGNVFLNSESGKWHDSV